MKIGISGTRTGLINPQREALQTILRILPITELHHGDCTGVDQQVHDFYMGGDLHDKIHVHIWPPANPKNRAYCGAPLCTIHPEQEYLVRNRDIVRQSDVLLACPKMMVPEMRGSGTWNAIRYAETNGYRAVIIWPNGVVSGWTRS